MLPRPAVARGLRIRIEEASQDPSARAVLFKQRAR